MNYKTGLSVLFLTVLLQTGLMMGVMAGASAEIDHMETWTQNRTAVPGRPLIQSGYYGNYVDLGTVVNILMGIGLFGGAIFLCIKDEVSESNKKHTIPVQQKTDQSSAVYRPVGPVNLNRLYVKEPNFSAERFVLWSKDLLISVISACRSQNMENLRPCVTKQLYEALKKRGAELKRANLREVWERISFKKADITSYREDVNYEYIHVQVQLCMIYYTEDIHTRELKRGNRGQISNHTYQLEFVRGIGVRVEETVQTAHCPHCGAPVDDIGGICAYCRSAMFSSDWNWVLKSLDDGALAA